MRARFPADVATITILAGVYFAAAKVGLMLAFVHASAPAVWPPTGIALAAILMLGYRVWPGILLGAFLANVTTEGTAATAAGIAIGNTSYGCRQGIRVYGSTNILAYGNTLFRNENSGIYLAKESVNGHVIANTLYENVKGARWSSGSTNGLAAGNVAFDNSEAGISVESTENVRLVGNRLVNNKRAQLLAIETRPLADGNCLESRGAGQLLAELSFFDKYDTLAPYQRAALRDHGSRQGGCGPLPEKLDVRKLHEESTGYAEKARKILAQAQQGHAKGVDDRSKAAGNPGDDDDE